ncbi:MAG: hypothetical protein PWQ70_862 [Clostridiales bacterium]|jgi:predicted dehydrogenase|nr:hypothetical protein [Clostridiales bacterium]
MNEAKIKWGVLGYARIAKLSVIPAILKASNSEFYAIASRDEEKLKECQQQFGCPKAYKNYDELLDDPEIQAVYIPLPNAMHKEWTVKAARKGKHILCEKPIGLNTEEAMEMIKACKENNVKLMEAFMYRYTDRTKKVRELLDSGVIGEVKYINACFRFFLNRPNTIKMKPELGGGALYDVGCYPINFAGMVMHSAPISMSAEYVMQDGVDVLASAILKYENGTICNINCGFNAFTRIYAEVVGTKGVLEIPDTFLDNGGTITVITEDGKKEVEVKECDRYLLEVEDFADAIINDRPPFFSLEETVRNMKILEQLIKLRDKEKI